MSDASERHPETGAASAKENAWAAVRGARSAWTGAMRAHELAPPDADFRGRLRALSEAAAAMRDAHARALEAGLAWRPVKGSDHARPPYELRPGTGRRGPEDLWARFDAAVNRLNQAGASDSVPGRRRPPFRSEIRTRAGAALPRALHCPRRGLTPRRPATDVEPLCRHFSTPSRLLTGQPRRRGRRLRRSLGGRPRVGRRSRGRRGIAAAAARLLAPVIARRDVTGNTPAAPRPPSAAGWRPHRPKMRRTRRPSARVCRRCRRAHRSTRAPRPTPLSPDRAVHPQRRRPRSPSRSCAGAPRPPARRDRPTPDAANDPAWRKARHVSASTAIRGAGYGLGMGATVALVAPWCKCVGRGFLACEVTAPSSVRATGAGP